MSEARSIKEKRSASHGSTPQPIGLTLSFPHTALVSAIQTPESFYAVKQPSAVYRISFKQWHYCFLLGETPTPVGVRGLQKGYNDEKESYFINSAS